MSSAPSPVKPTRLTHFNAVQAIINAALGELPEFPKNSKTLDYCNEAIKLVNLLIEHAEPVSMSLGSSKSCDLNSIGVAHITCDIDYVEFALFANSMLVISNHNRYAAVTRVYITTDGILVIAGPHSCGFYDSGKHMTIEVYATAPNARVVCLDENAEIIAAEGCPNSFKVIGYNARTVPKDPSTNFEPATEPVASEPFDAVASEPFDAVASEPAASEPFDAVASEPAASEPAASEPAASEPVATVFKSLVSRIWQLLQLDTSDEENKDNGCGHCADCFFGQECRNPVAH